ncbi:uncharacterized protein BJ171DRAFT_512715 [Polychytrium aggregatum]|uniref:uncharacterized protein n=1 Tax=Polychytrium aggregatum TaxID=110093 RepID=UPI0022FF26B7|nr:uncharacterized protein BJ171DRAFT_512715 [Polychytrium aggregatum]KAI9202618.1 hypothetical protein BJ171DRAFT_512715 [Polychytrium aggregatum]
MRHMVRVTRCGCGWLAATPTSESRGDRLSALSLPARGGTVVLAICRYFFAPLTPPCPHTSRDRRAAMDAFKHLNHVFHAHAAVADAKAWTELLKADPPHGALSNHALAKTLVVKPKGGKGPDVPLMIVALDSTATNLNAIAKHLGKKEARMANDDLISATLSISKNDVTPFALSNVVDKATIGVVIDDNVFADPERFLGFRAFAPDKTLFVQAAHVKSFLEDNGVDATILNFEQLASSAPASTTSTPKETKAAKVAKPVATAATNADSGDKQILIGIDAKKDEDFSTWYTQVLTRTEMMDYYDISGCYIIRPWAFKVWKSIQQFFGSAIEDLGVEDCYFPMFVSHRALDREKDHIEGFAPEVAWVTKAGSSDLAEPIAVRPTSETVMYPAYSQWVRSHRDLPLRLNQWCNVVRWEFKHPQPFLRTREFLWQEGHTVFASKEEADKEVLDILDLYRRVYEDLLAVPVVPGRKSEKEKFAGGLYTTTVEGFIPTSGRAIQGATSHCLGQSFSKMFNIMIENENKERVHVWQNSWGITTRTIGVMVMVHGDDKGLVLPPRVASIQAIVVPVGITAKTTDAERQALYDKANELVSTLKAAGVRAKSDTRDNYTPGYKYNHWEMKGVPLRLEVGPKDVAKNETRAVRRDTGVACQLSLSQLVAGVAELLEDIQNDMFAKAKKERDAHIVRLEKWEDGEGFVKSLDGKNLILAPWCERVACEEAVKERSSRVADGDEPQDEKAPSMGAKTLCIPFQQPTENPLVPGKTGCFACEHKAVSYTLWGRSY